LNFQRPAGSRTTAISLCVASRRPRAAWRLRTWRARNRHALREFWARAPADALGGKQELEKALAQNGKPTK
jgi:hypothetical protein